MKQIKSSKNQPKWTKTMSILTLSVALQTQACAGTKVAMMSTSFPPSKVSEEGNRRIPDSLENDRFQEAFQRAVTSMECSNHIESPSTYGAAFFKKEGNGNNGLHHLAERKGNLLEFEMVIMALERASKEMNRNPKEIIREMLCQQNKKGYSVLTVTLLPPKSVVAPSLTLSRPIKFLDRLQETWNRRKSKEKRCFRDVLGLINGYLEAQDRLQIISELSNLKSAGLLPSDCYSELIQCLTKPAPPKEIGSPTLVSGTATAYLVVQKALQGATKKATTQPSMSKHAPTKRRGAPPQAPTPPNLIPATFSNQLRAKADEFQARRRPTILNRNEDAFSDSLKIRNIVA
jgi:hypothetical protein